MSKNDLPPESETEAVAPMGPLSLPPFDFFSRVASRIPGLGGNAPGHDPRYVFHSPYVETARGPVSFTIRFLDLDARRGTLVLQVNMLPAEDGANARLVKTARIQLNRLKMSGGEVSVGFEGFRGVRYAVFGMIPDESDVTASGVEILLNDPPAPVDPSEIVEEAQTSAYGGSRLRSNPALVSLDRPTLAWPVSQVATKAQLAEPAYAEWVRRLRETGRPNRRQWERVFVLQALQTYGLLAAGARGLGFGPDADRIAAVIAAADSSIVSAGDGALGPEARYDALAAQGFGDAERLQARIDMRTADLADIAADLRNFDFLWSCGALVRIGADAAAALAIRESLRCLRPGGMAVHVFDVNAAGGAASDIGEGEVLRRRDVERIALTLIAHDCETAQIKFARGAVLSDAAYPGPAAITSFGLLVRRAPTHL